MIHACYARELDLLRHIARDFAQENPALAPMLGEPCNDPDVERLLEGVAFLTGAIRQKIDDEFPEIVHDLLRQVWPHALKALPSATLLAFFPDSKLSGPRHVKAGTFVDSGSGDGPDCRFRTCTHVDVHPLAVRDASYMNPPGQRPWIRVCFELTNQDLGSFRADRLRLHLGGPYREATRLFQVLTRHVRDIVIASDPGGQPFRPGLSSLAPWGFSDDESLIPWPSHAFEGFRLIQEYFLMPEKFLFIELENLEAWTDRPAARTFHVDFILDRAPENGVDCGVRHFTLFATPAVNVYPQSGCPVIVDHGRTDYPVRPLDSGKNSRIHSIEKVWGYFEGQPEGTAIPEYQGHPFTEAPCFYRERLALHPVHDRVDVSVSLASPGKKPLLPLKSLAFDVLVTQGEAPEKLKEGELWNLLSGAPESVSVRNLRKPTVSAVPPLGSAALWRFISLFSLNVLSLKHADDLKALLFLFVAQTPRDRHRLRMNEHKISGIREYRTRHVDRLIGGTLVRGLEVTLVLSQSHFAGMGDVALFGTVMSRFFGMYSTINSFTRLTLEETDSGEILCWEERMGRDAL